MPLEYPTPGQRKTYAQKPDIYAIARLEDLKPIIDEVNRIADAPTPSGGIETIVAGTGISVDNTDPANPIITNTSGANYKIYVALLTQTGTNAPTAVVLENTLGGSVTFGYSSVGVYNVIATGLLTINKTYINISQSLNSGITSNRASIIVANDSLTNNTFDFITTDNNDNVINDMLINTPIEIRVYN